jgi:type II secretory pathway pseudopilin PulG
MTASKFPHGRNRAGFTLPAILVVVGALLILAVGVLLVVGIERSTARSFVERQRAELAAAAGLENIRGILSQEAANDDFLVIQGALAAPIDQDRQPAPQLFIARGSKDGFRYTPLFSSAKAAPATNPTLAPPPVEPLVGTSDKEYKEFQTLPYQDRVRAGWLPVQDEKSRLVGRYAFWVEDLQSRVDATTAGNTKDAGAHKRYGWKVGDNSPTARFPAPGLNAEASNIRADGRDAAPPLDQIALHAVDPASGAKDNSVLTKVLIENRAALVSPDSVLAASGILPPLTRDKGRLLDDKARSLEESLSASVQAYDEQALIPFARGISANSSGKPKLNLNSLLAKSPSAAVGEMAGWIESALPDFQNRKGGFTQDYLKTIAANAIGYAAPGNKPVVEMGNYRGLGASPVVSEIVLCINYLGYSTRNGNKIMAYQFVLFAELLNHTNLPINGNSALSYEVGYNLPAIGAAPAGDRFDDPSLLGDPSQATHDLELQGGRYWSRPQAIALAPGEYKFFKFATVQYLINIGSGSIGSNFTLTEPLGAAGLSLKWNDEEVDRVPSIVRSSTGLTMSTGLRRYFGKAAIPGHSYGPFGSYINNMGDPRFAHYVSAIPLGENSFPGNISPNRRNIRLETIYKSDGATKLRTYGRVIPSEWPDGGHDAAVTTWNSGWSTARQGTASAHGTGPSFDPTTITGSTLPEAGEALTYLSDRGRFYSATELGRVYDPIMFVPTFDPASNLNSVALRGQGEPIDNAGFMPAAGVPWPLVQVVNDSSPYFGGGNTLRIGRPEHPKFNRGANGSLAPLDMPGTHAARLLDLFHAGKSRSEDKSLREGPLVRIEGHVNINTASRDALRAMAAGLLVMDPKLSRRSSDVFDSRMAPAIQPLTTLSAPTASQEADLIAEAIIRGRPYATPSELACARTADGKQVFGNPDLYPDAGRVQWTDSAAEEIFGRVYEASTVRSRNFRIWVVGQAVSPTAITNTSPEVLAEVRKVFTVFADPGERKSDGSIDPSKSRVQILHENDF